MTMARVGFAGLYGDTSKGKPFGVADLSACQPAQSSPALGDNRVPVGFSQDLFQLDRGSRIDRQIAQSKLDAVQIMPQHRRVPENVVVVP